MTVSLLNPSSTGEKRLDLLGRDQFVKRMLSITEALSAKKANSCYSIDGRWGVGKTYVLSMFEDHVKQIRISENDVVEKYLVFRYNCWEYDYYDEPLVAITAAMLDNIADNPFLPIRIPKERIINVLRATGDGLLKAAIEIVEPETGFDKNSTFNKHLKELKKEIAAISKEQTVLILVDELDRCLPEYTIKVLERLHHLFYGIENVQVILCLDYRQLEHTVKQIFGQETNVVEYLKKFIEFGIELDVGTIDLNTFYDRFHVYTEMFVGVGPGTTEEEIGDFIRTVLEGIDIRTRISLIDKCSLIHSFVANGETKDNRFLCLELFLAIINISNIDMEFAKRLFRIDHVFEPSYLFKDNKDNPREVPIGLTMISDLYKENFIPSKSHYIFTKGTYSGHAIYFDCLLGALLCVYRAVLGTEGDERYSTLSNKAEIDSFVNYGKKFWEFLHAIR